MYNGNEIEKQGGKSTGRNQPDSTCPMNAKCLQLGNRERRECLVGSLQRTRRRHKEALCETLGHHNQDIHTNTHTHTDTP